jgi:histone H3/H4
MRTRDGVEIPEPHWSYHKPTTAQGVRNELYGPKSKPFKRPQRHFRPASTSKLRQNADLARALREIRHWQKQTGTIIPRLAMIHTIREVVQDLSWEIRGRHRDVLNMSAEAHAALHLAAEAYLTSWFEMINLAAIHAKRQTVMPKDAAFLRSFLMLKDPSDLMAQPALRIPGRRRGPPRGDGDNDDGPPGGGGRRKKGRSRTKPRRNP